MKKFLKVLMLILIVFPAIVILGACEDNTESLKIKDIRQTAFTDKDVTYTITYYDGSTFSYTVPLNNVVSILSIEKTGTVNKDDIYTITLTNGSTTTFTVKNGVSLEDLYNEANVDNRYNNIIEFIQDYMSISLETNDVSYATNKAVQSCVSVYCKFEVIQSNIFGYNERVTTTSAGSGVIYKLDKENGDAYIITNCHVVYNSDSVKSSKFSEEVYVYLYGQEYKEYAIPCEIIGGSINYDIAVLKVTNSEILKNGNVRAIDLSDSDNVAIGDTAIAIGNPDAAGISATSGIISVISEYISVNIDSSIVSNLREFRIDAPVNRGNSGGGLFNDKGELIGIVNAKTNGDYHSSEVVVEGMGYAIPSNLVISVANNLINSYENRSFGVKKAYLGIGIETKSSKTIYDAETLTTKIVEEVKINNVESESLASSMGMQVGDVVLNVTVIDTNSSVRHYAITRYYQLIELMLDLRIGDSITINVKSEDNSIVACTTTLSEYNFIEVN